MTRRGRSGEIRAPVSPNHVGLATIIGITSHPDSRLRVLSDIILDMGIVKEACPLGLTPSASIAVMLSITDALSDAHGSQRHHQGTLGGAPPRRLSGPSGQDGQPAALNTASVPWRTGAPTSRTAKLAVVLLIALATPIALYAFAFQLLRIGEPTFHARFDTTPVMAAFHVIGGGFALLAGGFQFNRRAVRVAAEVDAIGAGQVWRIIPVVN